VYHRICDEPRNVVLRAVIFRCRVSPVAARGAQDQCGSVPWRMVISEHADATMPRRSLTGLTAAWLLNALHVKGAKLQKCIGQRPLAQHMQDRLICLLSQIPEEALDI
jgi:hypothetical protein